MDSQSEKMEDIKQYFAPNLLSSEQHSFLLEVAHAYIWWKAPEEALRYPRLLVAKIMDHGRLNDTKALLDLYSDEYLIKVLQHAEIGQFSQQSWHFWHYRLCKSELEQVPPLPTRFK